MKKIAIVISFALLFIFTGKQEAEAQCKQQMVYKCATKGGNAIYLRDFNTKLNRVRSGKDDGTKWTVVLNKGTRYRFILCTPPGLEDQVVLTLFDGQHPEDENPWLKTSENRNVMDYICRRSGMYYVSIKWKEGYGDKKSCAVGILSFVGKNQ